MTQCVAIPAFVTAGLSFRASVDDARYLPPAWTCTLHLRGAGTINLTGAPSGSRHDFTAAPAATSAWAPGDYWWTLRATNGADVVELGTGQLKITPDLAAVTGTYDGRTENEKALAAIDAVLAKRATIDQQRYVINNRELWRTPVPELLKLRAFYNTRVRRERAAKRGGGLGRIIPVRFS